MVKRIIIIGAIPGIGYEVAKTYWERGYQLGSAGHRADRLEEFRKRDPGHIRIKQLDATVEDVADRPDKLICDLEGMDIFLLSSGIGNQNRYSDTSIEQAMIQTNVTGFTCMALAVHRYFPSQSGGHISVTSSIAGTKGLGIAPPYLATRRYQNICIDTLAQLSRMEKWPIAFTDIRPGFARTDLLKDGRNYSMLVSPQYIVLCIANATNRKKRGVVVDWGYAILVFFRKLIPEWLWERLPMRN